MKFSYTLLKKLAPVIKSSEQLMEALAFHAFEVEKVDGDVIDIVIPANRYSDAASHYGMAVVVSAILGKKTPELKLPALKSKAQSLNFKVGIDSKKLCPRYSGLYAEINKIGKSPEWMQKILISCGLRPINNIVDVMNYVMLEIGQPLHAFDFDEIESVKSKIQNPKSKNIVVRLAKEGEKIETIDGGKYDLDVNDLVIADEKGALAIAGVKGGKRAEVSLKTKRIIVEAANFDSVSVYKTSRRLNLFTDASARFSHGLAPVLVEKGIKRAAQLLKEVCGARLGDWLDVNYVKPSKTIIKFDVERFNKLTGLSLSEKACLEYLKKLGFQARGKFIEPPAERTDILIFEDLAEEIVNLYGYDRLLSVVPRALLSPSGAEDQIVLKDKIRSILTGFGLSEVYNYSFIGEPDPNLQNKFSLVELVNPIADDKKYLRPSLFPHLTRNIEENFRFYDEVRIFEIGRVFAKASGKNGIASGINEQLSLGIALGLKKGAPFLELKGIVEQMLGQAGLVDYFTKEDGEGRLRLESDHRTLGYLIAKDNKALAEINLDELLQLVVGEKEYRPLPKYPSATRDLSFMVDAEARVAAIQNIIENTSHLLDDADLLDWYEDPKLGPNRKSLTFRLVFQAEDRTLTDEEVDQELGKIVASLKEKFDVELR
ncbi:MAG: phenylalanine--tRNA ligase subunit beta [Candidatus Harrisonbacteria bacterium RIFCSPHIGHO2_01_FULL_44_13]|uniref:Phenylalanine--tRNA ligase beta subunit n=1 Tax=Candidatus Harrisonbacteria bacterium RIFCSPLOWO2_01_FULL_44_18 TaxID=1798407 RepID=A0A1G1ZKN6_9BACT|nr:MAG: phenylalanine--tRNA ligase subunit beta [Candidatus Harrisonbacteria bacterium RIFCSPHIGHO2_01_FULL_44_13]OGY65193.1 MAG: phenylalanine--tRNA ligase subunit beta [Candidatus Harrisonbacteria bacterium RIFCSPLOWO2_01_FULL_44_18]